jgi:ribosomal protein S18 acetylase RimI-like enzyme
VLKTRLRDYFEKWIPVDGLIACIAENNGDICSTAFLSIVERPPRAADSSYLVGTIYNVYTYPTHRRKGFATEVMRALLSEAKIHNVASVDLLSTDDGKRLYEKLGFQLTSYTPMRMKL